MDLLNDMINGEKKLHYNLRKERPLLNGRVVKMNETVYSFLKSNAT